MVTKSVTKEEAVCDICGNKDAYYKCLSCGKDMCYEHFKTHAVRYSHAVNFSGSGDGIFCHECDSNPQENVKKLHSLYNDIISLKNESNNFYKQFEIRSKACEDELHKEYKKVMSQNRRLQ